MSDARELVERARVARLATLDDDGRAHLVPITFAFVGDTLYTAVDAKPKRSTSLRRIENARRREDVTVLVDHYADDWTQLWWVRLRGTARVLERGEEADAAIAALSAKYPQYREQRPQPPVLAVAIAELVCWSADGRLS